MAPSALVPIAKAAPRLGRSIWTLKRWHRRGLLPVVIIQGQWHVPESFLVMVAASPQPGQAGDMQAIATAWFAANSGTPAAAVAS